MHVVMKPISDKKTQMQNINRIWLGQKLICKAYVGHMFIKVLVTAFFSLPEYLKFKSFLYFKQKLCLFDPENFVEN